MPLNLVLIGYRGTGKSAVARLLSRRLRMARCVMDDEIELRAGMSIPDYVAAQGWPAFRDLETAVVRDLARRKGVILDCGGGVIERPENMPALKEHGTVFWLRASVATIVARIGSDTQRPALTAGGSFTDEVEAVLSERNPKYEAAADHVVGTDSREVSWVVDEIIDLWQKRRGRPGARS